MDGKCRFAKDQSAVTKIHFEAFWALHLQFQYNKGSICLYNVYLNIFSLLFRIDFVNVVGFIVITGTVMAQLEPAFVFADILLA